MYILSKTSKTGSTWHVIPHPRVRPFSTALPRWSCIFQALDRTALHSHRRLEMSDIFHLFFFSKNDNQANCTNYSKRVEKDESTNMIHYKTMKWYVFQFASTMAQNYSPFFVNPSTRLPRQVSLPSFDSWCPKGLEAHAPKLPEDSGKNERLESIGFKDWEGCQRKVF